MKRLTLRIPDELGERLRRLASDRGESVNSLATKALTAMLNPELAGEGAQRMRERLRAAGLTAEPGTSSSRASSSSIRVPSEQELRAARVAAGAGKPLSEYVSEGRG